MGTAEGSSELEPQAAGRRSQRFLQFEFGQQLARYGMKMKKRYSPFDYTITINRKDRYLVVSSPQFGFQVATGQLDLRHASPEGIGEAVIRVLASISQRLRNLELCGEAHPEPKKPAEILGGGIVSISEAAKLLGIHPATLRKAAREGWIRSKKTPGGHLRFSLEALASYLAAEGRNPSEVTNHEIRELKLA